MKSDEQNNANFFPTRKDNKDIKPLLEKDKTPILPNVQSKTSFKVPEGAKKIGNYILGNF